MTAEIQFGDMELIRKNLLFTFLNKLNVFRLKISKKKSRLGIHKFLSPEKKESGGAFIKKIESNPKHFTF